MAARWTTWIVWAALAGSVVYWGLHLFGRASQVPPHAETVAAAQAAQGDVLRLFAASRAASEPQAAAVPELASRFRLLGVVAPAAQGSPGWALISVDGKAARAVAKGAVVEGEWILQSVTQTGVAIGPRGSSAVVTLDLALLPPPATGTLAMAGGGAGTVSSPAGAPAGQTGAAAVPASPEMPMAPVPAPPSPPVATGPGRLVPGRFGPVPSTQPRAERPDAGAPSDGGQEVAPSGVNNSR